MVHERAQGSAKRMNQSSIPNLMSAINPATKRRITSIIDKTCIFVPVAMTSGPQSCCNHGTAWVQTRRAMRKDAENNQIVSSILLTLAFELNGVTSSSQSHIERD